MNLIFSFLKLAFVLLGSLVSICALIVKNCLLVLFSESEPDAPSKSIYLLDENGNEFIDDGVTFGYELDDAYNYRNRP